MYRRSGRLASRQSGDAKERDEKRSEEEQGESSSMHAKVPQEWDDDDDDEYDEDRDTEKYTQSRRKMSARAIATPASSKKIRDSLTVTYEDSEFELSEPEEDEEFLIEGEFEQECFDLSELPLDPSEVPPEEPEVDYDDDELETHQSNKRARISIDTAEQWISDFNRANPVNDDDPDLLRFRETLKIIVERICNWAREDENGSLKAWFKSPVSERHTTSQFRSVLAQVDIQQLIDNLFEHMPKCVQKIFGKQDLRPMDLLDLPQVPHSFSHRLTYTNIPVRAGVNNITRLPGVKGKPVKSIKPDAQLGKEAPTKVYLGSAISKLGAYTRIRAHEEGSDGKVKEKSVHYDFTKQPDVAPNLRIIGVWSNPFVVDSLDSPNDIDRWLPVFLEGILMVYLGLVHRSNVPLVDRSLQGVFAEAKYVLIDRLRSNLELPDFHNQSLNLAWSIAQGVNGGMLVVHECSNPACRRPKFFQGKKQRFLTVNGKLSERICLMCYQYARKHDGELRTANKARYDKSQGARVCNNPNCRKVEGSDDKGHFKADILDKTKWRCQQCYDWQRRHKGEDRPAELPGPVGDNRSCCNPNCDRVQVPGGPKITWKKRVTATGTVEYRCSRCMSYLQANGIDRPSEEQVKLDRKERRARNRNAPRTAPPVAPPAAPPAAPTPRSCSNCGQVQDTNGKKVVWYKNKAAEGTFRCRPCHNYFTSHDDEERPQHMWTH
ncbi:hypothetical protein FPRO05_06517 [Fusarium proliferatum]|uniref:Uncharacterized protein n=1 Tax=Gibberella intermedia TaxID=948311 RepID=A0A365MLE5_GIBIN|nr:hypothetical protein FPRO05_06517 [Fusarium proliferatum]